VNHRIEINTYEKNPIVRNWIEQLHTYSINFDNYTIAITNKLLIRYIETILLGEQCIGFGGDEFIATGYYLIMDILKFPNIDNFLAEMLPPLLDIERQVVNYQLAHIKDPNINPEVRRRVLVLKERQAELMKPIGKVEIFRLEDLIRNIHT